MTAAAPAPEAPPLSRDPWAHAPKPTVQADLLGEPTEDLTVDIPSPAGGSWVPVTCQARDAVAGGATLNITTARTVRDEAVFTVWDLAGTLVIADMVTDRDCWHLLRVNDPDETKGESV